MGIAVPNLFKLSKDITSMNRLIWFRNDLRIHDNEALSSALRDASGEVNFVFIYDEKWDALTPEGYPRLGPFRKRLLAESLIDLRQNLQPLGANLVCLFGDPVQVIPKVCDQLDVHEIFYSRLSVFDERQQEIAIVRELNSKNVKCYSFQTHTLFCQDDFADLDLSQSMSFSKFRKLVEKNWSVRPPSPAVTLPRAALTTKIINHFSVWSPESFLNDIEEPKLGFHASGGESQALERVNEYFWKADQLCRYKETRNGLLARNDSSKISPSLALGCVSARSLYAEVRRYENERFRNSSTLWFLYELLWRDYFHFAALRRGSRLFTDAPESVPAHLPQIQQSKVFESWRKGQTDNSFMNAAMTELRLTGWMSNRMRQNAASYLIHDLGVNWRAGARWFETCLIDYDPASNWGNWSYIAGAGPENQPHIFDVQQQAKAYDPNAEYEKFWSAV